MKTLKGLRYNSDTASWSATEFPDSPGGKPLTFCYIRSGFQLTTSDNTYVLTVVVSQKTDYTQVSIVEVSNGQMCCLLDHNMGTPHEDADEIDTTTPIPWLIEETINHAIRTLRQAQSLPQ